MYKNRLFVCIKKFYMVKFCDFISNKEIYEEYS